MSLRIGNRRAFRFDNQSTPCEEILSLELLHPLQLARRLYGRIYQASLRWAVRRLSGSAQCSSRRCIDHKLGILKAQHREINWLLNNTRFTSLADSFRRLSCCCCRRCCYFRRTTNSSVFYVTQRRHLSELLIFGEHHWAVWHVLALTGLARRLHRACFEREKNGENGKRLETESKLYYHKCVLRVALARSGQHSEK